MIRDSGMIPPQIVGVGTRDATWIKLDKNKGFREAV